MESQQLKRSEQLTSVESEKMRNKKMARSIFDGHYKKQTKEIVDIMNVAMQSNS